MALTDGDDWAWALITPLESLGTSEDGQQKTILQRINDRIAAARDLLLPRLMKGEISI